MLNLAAGLSHFGANGRYCQQMIAKTRRAKRIIKMEVEVFAANCLSLIDEVYEHNIEIIVTRSGEPLVRIIRYVEKKSTKKARSTKR